MKKGFFVLMDILLAITISFILILIIYNNYFYDSVYNDNYKLGLNVLSIIENTSAYKNTETIRNILNNSPDNVCLSFGLIDANVLIYDVVKNNCYDSDDAFVIYGSIYDNNFKITKLKVWVKNYSG